MPNGVGSVNPKRLSRGKPVHPVYHRTQPYRAPSRDPRDRSSPERLVVIRSVLCLSFSGGLDMMLEAVAVGL